jgi:hypothetical protein
MESLEDFAVVLMSGGCKHWFSNGELIYLRGVHNSMLISKITFKGS